MCQLLGISSNKNVNIEFSLKGFRHRGSENPHGWGFAFFCDNNEFKEKKEWKLFKNESSLWNEDIETQKFKFKSKLIIGHVRFASCGNKTHENTHPFKIEKYVFAHNGDVRRIIKQNNLSTGEFIPKGKTDSEYAFCYLLSKIKSNPLKDIVKILIDESEKIKHYGNFNYLLSDGKKLYAYGDKSLYYVKRESPFSMAKLIDEQYEVNLEDIKDSDEKAIIIATEPLTKKEEWEKIEGLKAFFEGDLLY